MSELSLSVKAGTAIAPVLRPFHINIDFQDPAHCRIDDETLVLLVSNAIQENRLRQLQKRIKAALAVAGLPLTEVAIRIVPQTAVEYRTLDLPRCERPASASGAAAIDRTLCDIEDPELKDTLRRLRDTLRPDAPLESSALEEKLAQESLALVMHRRELCLLESDLNYGLETSSIPTEEEVAEFPPLAGVRERLLCKHARQTARLEAARADIERIDRRLDIINEALTLLPDNPIQAEALASGNMLETSDEKHEEHTQPIPVSAAAHAALSSLVRQTSSPSLRKTLKQLCRTLTPSENNFSDSLRADIRHEINRLTTIEPTRRSEKQKKRLNQLTEALSRLNQSDSGALELADELYGHIV